MGFEELPASRAGSCEGVSPSMAVNERPSTISMPPVASNGAGENRTGSQLVCAVQVGRKPPTLWYLGGGIRIGVPASTASARLAAKRSRTSAPIRMTLQLLTFSPFLLEIRQLGRKRCSKRSAPAYPVGMRRVAPIVEISGNTGTIAHDTTAISRRTAVGGRPSRTTSLPTSLRSWSLYVSSLA